MDTSPIPIPLCINRLYLCIIRGCNLILFGPNGPKVYCTKDLQSVSEVTHKRWNYLLQPKTIATQRLWLRVQIHMVQKHIQPVRIFIIVIMSGCRRGISRTTLISAFSHYFLYQTVILSLVQCNLDYPDSLGPNKTVRISYSPDKRGRFIHSGIGMGLVSMFG